MSAWRQVTPTDIQRLLDHLDQIPGLREFLTDLSGVPRRDHPGRLVMLDYTNWRGERAERIVLVERLWWGSSQFHPDQQWLLEGEDIKKGAELRDFALLGIRKLEAATLVQRKGGQDGAVSEEGVAAQVEVVQQEVP